MTTAVKGWEVYTLYNGEVTLGFDKNGNRTGYRHSYWLKVPKSEKYPEGRKLIPGVTGISGLLTDAASGLSPWAARLAVNYVKDSGIEIPDDIFDAAVNAHNTQRDKAAVRGTAVHKYVERLAGGEVIPKDEQKTPAYKAAAAVIAFLQAERIKIVECETKVYSRKHEYCGTMDLDVRLADGTRAAIVDIKTSKAFRLAHAMQIAAYAKAREEEFPDTKYEDAGVLLAAAKPQLKWLSHAMRMPGPQALDACFNAFLGLLAVKTSIPNIKNFGQEDR